MKKIVLFIVACISLYAQSETKVPTPSSTDPTGKLCMVTSSTALIQYGGTVYSCQGTIGTTGAYAKLPGTGGGGGTIPNTGNLLVGGAANTAGDSGVSPANVVTSTGNFTANQILFGAGTKSPSTDANFLWVGSTQKLIVGNLSSGGSTAPASFDLGNSFGTNTPGSTGNLKLLVFDPGYGFGLSGGILEYQVPSGDAHTFYVAGTAIETITNVGLEVLPGSTLKSPKIILTGPCTSTASPAVCGSSAAGKVQIAASATTLTINTTAVSGNSVCSFGYSTAGLTAPTNLTSLGPITETAQVAATSVSISIPVAPLTSPINVKYACVN